MGMLVRSGGLVVWRSGGSGVCSVVSRHLYLCGLAGLTLRIRDICVCLQLYMPFFILFSLYMFERVCACVCVCVNE